MLAPATHGLQPLASRRAAYPLLVPWLLACVACADIGQPFPTAPEPVDDTQTVVGSPDTAIAGPDDVQTGVDVGDEGSPDPDSTASDSEAPPDLAIPDSTDAAEPETGGEDVEQADVEPSDTAPPGDTATDEGPCTPCFTNADCPDGVLCVEITALDGSLCGGPCLEPECPPGQDGLATGCARTTIYGTCSGVRSCFQGTLSACSAHEAVLEQCNGSDDDCDAQVDEGFPDLDLDGQPNCSDTDDDADAVPDLVDNCPAVPNTDQVDRDFDGDGDSCDDDIDGDGVPNDQDCAPLDPNASGGGPETCNGKDDNCNGQTDEPGAVGCKSWFPDSDGDSFGATALALCQCGASAIRPTSTPGDCNDSNPFIHPAATEICDGQDNDCDTVLDEEGAADCSTYRYDADGDTYHIPIAVGRCLCAPSFTDLYTGLQSGDCNDQNPTIHPGAIERCDGGDESCDFVNDEGCDDDQDGFCDDGHAYELTGSSTCLFGPGDCDDLDPDIHPGISEVCDGKDTNCNVGDDKPEGTIQACGPFCAACPKPPAGSAYYCTGLGIEGACLLECAGGKFCADCSCDGSTLFTLGTATPDAKVIYDAAVDTFRVAYFSQGDFRLRAIGPSGGNGNDVAAVTGVTKWTRWDVTQNPSTGDFFFAWTAYPDSAVRIGVASVYGTAVSQYIVAPDLSDGNYRQNTALAWSQSTQTFLLLWDETTSFGADLRGILLGPTAAPYGEPFEVVGGSGDQTGGRIGSRLGNKGVVLSLAMQSPPLTVAHPEMRLSDHTGSTTAVYSFSPEIKGGTLVETWFDPKVDRGVLQWLATDDQYRSLLVGPDGPIGAPIPIGYPVAVATGAPKQNAMRVFFAVQGGLRSRLVDKATGDLGSDELQLAATGTVTGVVGAALHPLGYSIVLWNTVDGLTGRLVAP